MPFTICNRLYAIVYPKLKNLKSQLKNHTSQIEPRNTGTMEHWNPGTLEPHYWEIENHWKFPISNFQFPV